MHLRATTRLFILPALAAFGMISVFGFMTYTIGEKKAKISSLEASIAGSRAKEASFKATRALLESIGETPPGIDGYFLQDSNTVQFIEQIEVLARRAGVSPLKINSVMTQPLPSAGAGDVEEIKLDAQTEGDWGKTTRFLSMLESIPFPASFQNLSLGKAGEEKGVTVWSLSFIMTVAKLK